MPSEDSYIDYDVSIAISKIIKGLNDLDRSLASLNGSWKFCVSGEVKLGFLDGDRDMAILHREGSGKWIARVVHGVKLHDEDEI